MVFSSLSFLFLFLPCVIILYYLFPGRLWKNCILLLFSLLFYFWGDPYYLAIMIIVALIVYCASLLMDEKKPHRSLVFILAVALITGNLVFFKYLNFFLENIGFLFHISVPTRSVKLPLGISFYTFQVLSYLIDLYHKRIPPQRNFFYLLLYICLFPQLIAGPIVRYQTIESEIVSRKENSEQFSRGLSRFIRGLAKKVLIANNVAIIAEKFYAGNPDIYGSAALIVASLSYTLQIYYDFSGYSDMAIGLGALFGFHFPENFNYPYSACSITDFWHRWHISLSSWFRDYVYIPLGGNRVSKYLWIRNIMLVWALTGLWHGASWNFILWGIYYGILLIFEKRFFSGFSSKWNPFFKWILTFSAVNFGWIMFAFPAKSQLISIIRRLVSLTSTNWLIILAENIELARCFLFLFAGLIFMFPVQKKLQTRFHVHSELVQTIISMILFSASIISLISSSYNPFIYFRF